MPEKESTRRRRDTRNRWMQLALAAAQDEPTPPAEPVKSPRPRRPSGPAICLEFPAYAWLPLGRAWQQLRRLDLLSSSELRALARNHGLDPDLPASRLVVLLQQLAVELATAMAAAESKGAPLSGLNPDSRPAEDQE